MLIATKKNKQLHIEDSKLERYKAEGWTVRDTAGKIVYEPIDPAKEIALLKAENESLKEQLAKLKTAKAKKTAATAAAKTE